MILKTIFVVLAFFSYKNNLSYRKIVNYYIDLILFLLKQVFTHYSPNSPTDDRWTDMDDGLCGWWMDMRQMIDTAKAPPDPNPIH